MFSMPSGSEWLIVLLIVMIFFGAGKLPDVLKSLGQGVKAFKDASTGAEDEEAPAPKKKSNPQIAARSEDGESARPRKSAVNEELD